MNPLVISTPTGGNKFTLSSCFWYYVQVRIYNKYGFIFNPGSKYISGNIFSLCVKSAALLVEEKRYWEGDRISETTTNTLCFSYLQEEISQPALPKCLFYSHCFITAQPVYSEVLLTSVSACLKTNACLFWRPGASRLHPSCSVSSSALEPLALFTLPYHRHDLTHKKPTFFSFL